MYFEYKEAKFYYEILGEGVPILMLHGCSPDHNLMTGCMEPIFRKKDGFQRIYLDLPGMGESDAPDWINCSDDILSVVVAFIKEIIGSRSFLIAGESYGGYLARGIILHYKKQIDGMLLICPVIKAMREERKCPIPVEIRKDEVFLSTLSSEQKEQFCDGAVVQNEYVYNRFVKEIDAGLKKANVSFIRNFKKNYAFTFDVDALPAAKYEGPVLIITGRQDSCVGYEDQWKILENYPRASFACIDEAGHNLQIENPVIFHCMVHDWLERVLKNKKKDGNMYGE